MSLSRAIGGYFELELRNGQEYHQDAIRLNTGRNALEYVLWTRKYRKLYLPYYTCNALLQPVKRLGLEYEYYPIDESFEPLFDFTRLEKGDAFLYTNYYGLKDQYIQKIGGKVPGLIIDNAQAFFSKPVAGVDSFNSARKFFGVPDGAYLYTEEVSELEFEQDKSFTRCAHLLIRADDSAENGYPFFVESDESLDNNPIRQMSRLTQGLLGSVDYENVIQRRKGNFAYLHEALKHSNLLNMSFDSEAVPLAYPYLTGNEQLRAKLIEERVYIAQYWPEAADMVECESVEYRFAHNLLPLPIDQRLTKEDLEHITNLIFRYEHQG